MEIKEVKDRGEWNSLFRLALRSNISQDWDYGRFKELAGGIQARRFKIVDANIVVGIFQTFEKKPKWSPHIRIIYLNRGPLILENSTSYKALLILIAKKYSLLKGCVFLLNPFKSLRNGIMKDLRESRFFNLKLSFYETSYVDLMESEAVLRSKLHSKWRNQLVKSEKSDAEVYHDLSETHVEFILKTYDEMVRNKQFNALRSDELRVLFEVFIKHKKLIISVALDSEETIIGYTIYLTFCNRAVYFIGWSNSKGRKLNVSNLLLWNSIVYLKKGNYKELDLGGYDSKNLPGIASFKKRLGGTEELYTERWMKLF